jgi:hypothetical protein
VYYNITGGKNVMSKIKVTKGRRSPMVTHQDEKRRDLRARMKWLLDFLNADIDSLNPVECLKLFLDFWVFMEGSSPPRIGYAETAFKQGRSKDKERKFLNAGQDLLRGVFQRILVAAKQIDPIPDSEGFGQLQRFDTYPIYYNVLVTRDRVFKHRALYVADEKIMKFLENKELITDALIDVLSPFPLSRIKTCQKPDCRKYFYQKTTKSKGDFCSPKCQNWARTNRWRNANPDKYNAYHRNRRSKAKEPWIKITCLNCGHEYPKGYTDPGTCSKCGGGFKYKVQFFEERKWKSEQCRNYNEAEEFRKEILEFEKSEGRTKNGKR